MENVLLRCPGHFNIYKLYCDVDALQKGKPLPITRMNSIANADTKIKAVLCSGS